ncbi:MAG: hypothetical protein U1F30_11020 [Steroidobacteraceae bacterium]
MRALKVVAVLASLTLTSFAGYSLSEWRMYGRVLPAFLNSLELSHALFLAKSAEQLDGGNDADVRARMLSAVRMKLEAPFVEERYGSLATLRSYRLSTFFSAPFAGPDEALGILGDMDKQKSSELERLMVKLCAASPQTDRYRHVCNR